jgi:hypothetical protein
LTSFSFDDVDYLLTSTSSLIDVFPPKKSIIQGVVASLQTQKKTKRGERGKKGGNIFWGAQIYTKKQPNQNKSAEREAKKKEHRRVFKKRSVKEYSCARSPASS